jgi:hypothetical protein
VNDAPPKSDPALKRLEKLVGTWNLTGRTLDATDDNISGWNTFEWMPGGFLLQSTGQINFKGFVMNSLEIIGYDEASDTFRAQVYSSMYGSSRILKTPTHSWRGWCAKRSWRATQSWTRCCRGN